MDFGPSLPDKVGRYEIVLQIARGGMATVYLARAEGIGGFDRYVALKLTAEHLRGDPEFAHHLIEEAKLVAHLRHTNVVPVVDVGENEMGAVFLVMEYVPGDSLAGLIRSAKKKNEPMPPAIGMRILVDALAGLHAAHEHTDEDGNSQRLVHRDFSPHNILVGTDGIARLTDFGIAKAASRASVTLAGTVKGKVSYASPEQARGHDLDRRCDVWAAGVIAWEIVAQRKLYPPHERTLLDIVKAVPPRLRSIVPDVPEEIDQVIAKALTMEPADRTPTAQVFGRAIAAAARNASLLAEVEEVAEYVQGAVARVLNERKEKIAQTRRLRELAAKPAEVEEPATATYAMKTIPFSSSLPDIPMVPEGAPMVTGGQLTSGATVPIPKPPVDAAPTMLSPARAQAPAAPTKMSPVHPLHAEIGPAANAVVESPSATPSGVSAPAFPPPVLPPPPLPPGDGIEPSPASLLLNRATKWIELVVDRGARLAAERPMVVVAGTGALVVSLLLLSIVVVALGRSDDTTAKGSQTASSAAATPLASASVVAPVPTRIAPAPPAATSNDVARAPVQLEVAANAPIALLRVGGRAVDMVVAAPNITVELLPEESTTNLTLSATSTDGRSASGTWAPGDSEVSLVFGDRKAVVTPPPKTRPTLPRR